MLTDLVEIHFIEIPKFNELKVKNLKEDRLQRWLTFFNKDISEEKLKELIEMDKDIKRVEERLEYLSSDAKTIEIYKAREKSLHERANMISSAREEGIKEGMEKGIKKGMEKGIEKGIKEGIFKIAKNLLVMGMDEDTVSKATGLSVEEIKNLKQ
ncbi:PD-(D/E)XK nuclease family transposase [Clostridium tepidiprofundi DSM 19306]|uniref:PD-(D/E)XK nuclease family transposase n=2 Tax=Clostridium TaxID=1485 RepID=A0A151AK56_9CLOT|nr:PD-(D/E)XK nuclease family transposase [Clostridium tepidiprofundi DSM 19306]